jgi:CHAD domain-containing protein
MRADATLWTAVVANTFFWFLGSLLLLNIVLYATDILHVDDPHSSYLLAALSLGIGIGSFLAGFASGKKIEPGMILPGLGGILLMAALLSRPGISYLAVLVQLSLLGVAGGFFVVPVNALIQQRPRPEEKGRTIAVANLLSFVGVALQPLAQYAMLRLGHPDPSRVFLIAAAMATLMGFVLLACYRNFFHRPWAGPGFAPELLYSSPLARGCRPSRSRRAVSGVEVSMATALSRFAVTLLVIDSRSPVAVAPVSGPRSEHRGLSHWMNRVLEELGSLQSSPDPDTVNDLRVAIRRCRSLAAVMEEVDPDPAWPEMRKVARRVFRALGDLRDTQVMVEWVKKLGPENDPLRAQLLASLETAEKQLSETALRVAAKFDEKGWTRLERRLRQRARLVPTGGLAAECLALERFEEAKELHNRALRTEKPKPWHTLRIGLKRFRYTIEGLLPDHYAAWSENLKRLQDLLGDVHDLDVLSELLKDTAPEAASRKSGKKKSLVNVMPESRPTASSLWARPASGTSGGTICRMAGVWKPRQRHGYPSQPAPLAPIHGEPAKFRVSRFACLICFDARTPRRCFSKQTCAE